MDVSIVLDAISSVIALISERKLLTVAEKRDARIALSTAYHTTEGYYAELDSGAEKSRAREHEIARLWHEVSIRVEPYDHNLAFRLGLKSRYWREAANWSDEQISDAKIGLETIRQTTNFILTKR